MFEILKNRENAKIWEFGNGDIGIAFNAIDENGAYIKCYRFNENKEFVKVEEFEEE